MVKIAFTPPSLLSPEHEARVITALLKKEVDYVHLRHPEANRETLRKILEGIDADLRVRITLHDHYDLAYENLAGGIQINARNRGLVRNGSNIRVGRSCHSIKEVQEAIADGSYDYATLSPIYNSISKPGYMAAFEKQILSVFLHSSQLPVVALGGVTPDKLPELQTLGFKGAAMLGYYFPYFEAEQTATI